jgi:hypothetical protein
MLLEQARRKLLDARKEIALRAGKQDKQDAQKPKKIKDLSSLNDEEL